MVEGYSPDQSAVGITLLSKTDSSTDTFLGTTDLGFDQSQYQASLTRFKDATKAFADYQQRLRDEKLQLEAELNVTRLSRGKATSTGMTPQEAFAKEKRLRELNWGLGDDEYFSLKSEIDTSQKEVQTQEWARPDSLDLREVYQELNVAQLLPEIQIRADSNRGVISQAKRDDLPSTELVQADLLDDAQEISSKIPLEVWFHSTKPNHFLNMIVVGGLATQSWLRNKHPEYYETLKDHSVALGTTKDIELSSPFNPTDADKIYFRNDRVEQYGTVILGFAPENIIPESGIFAYPKGWQHDQERVMSDVVDKDHIKLAENGSSQLQVAFDTAVVAVKKQDYRKIVQALLLAGYSQEWIAEHVFSYRENANSDGLRAAEVEIKKRIEEQRKKSSRKVAALAINQPYGSPHLYELKAVS